MSKKLQMRSLGNNTSWLDSELSKPIFYPPPRIILSNFNFPNLTNPHAPNHLLWSQFTDSTVDVTFVDGPDIWYTQPIITVSMRQTLSSPTDILIVADIQTYLTNAALDLLDNMFDLNTTSLVSVGVTSQFPWDHIGTTPLIHPINPRLAITGGQQDEEDSIRIAVVALRDNL